MTLRIGFDLTQCACAHDMSNRLIPFSPITLMAQQRIEGTSYLKQCVCLVRLCERSPTIAAAALLL